VSSQWISDALRAATEERAGWRCEYCLVPAGAVMWPHEPDHVIATQHRGGTELPNLALACFHCNRLPLIRRRAKSRCFSTHAFNPGATISGFKALSSSL